MASPRKIIAGMGWVAFFSLPLIWVYSWDPLDATVTRLSHYQTTRRELPKVLVNHFPTELPKRNVWYDYTPGVVQATPEMQLPLKLPTPEIDDIYRRFEKIAIAHFVAYDLGAVDSTAYEMRAGHPMWVFEANRIGHPAQNSDDHYFVTYVGHGPEPASAGVCINRKLGTVIYYCDLGKQQSFD